MLSMHSITVAIDNAIILNNLNLELSTGSIHALLGPNGSGKSTLAYTIAGHPLYHLVSGKIVFNNEDISSLKPHERAKKGIFLGFQQPVSLPGLSVLSFLKAIYHAKYDQSIDIQLFEKMIFTLLECVGLSQSFAFRNVNEGFSGGERKRFEIVQCLLLKPNLIILDEIDSGLDFDALKLISNALVQLKKENPHTSILIITHHQRIFNYLKPDFVHLINKGMISTGTIDLLSVIEQRGYNAV